MGWPRYWSQGVVLLSKKSPKVASKTALLDEGFFGTVIKGEMCITSKGEDPKRADCITQLETSLNKRVHVSVVLYR